MGGQESTRTKQAISQGLNKQINGKANLYEYQKTKAVFDKKGKKKTKINKWKHTMETHNGRTWLRKGCAFAIAFQFTPDSERRNARMNSKKKKFKEAK